MKAILLLCLIAALNCDLMDTALCLVGNNKIRSFVSLVIDTAKNQNFFRLFQIALSNYKELK